MNRQETKCASLPRFPSMELAQRAAAAKKVKHVAYACECNGFHAVKVGLTRNQARRVEQEAYYGDLLRIVHSMTGREIARLEAAGVPRRKYKRNQE